MFHDSTQNAFFLKHPNKAEFNDVDDSKVLSSDFQGLRTYAVWQYGLWSFQTGDTKLERFLPKNQHTQRKLLN